MADSNQIEQTNTANTVLFSESVEVDHEQQYIIKKGLMIVDALKADGCFNAEVLAPIPNIRDEWITLIQFDNESFLRRWLDSEEYDRAFARIEPYIKSTIKQFFSNFNQNISFSMTTNVSAKNEQKWLNWNKKIYDTMTSFPGFVGSKIQPLTRKKQGGNKTWIINLQFNKSENLKNWLESPQRVKLMQEGSDLYESSLAHQVSTGFSSWFNFNTQKSSTVAGWKMPFIIEMALYPLLIAQASLTPFVKEWFPVPVALLINSFYGCFLLHYLFVPGVQKLMNFWLLPRRNKKQEINLIGVILSIIYLLIICYFSVKFIFS